MPDKSGGCSPLTVSFTNTSTGVSSSATYSWDLGNAKVSSLPSPGSTYINEQTYTITLTVKDGSQTSTSSQTITVYKKPSVDFSASPTQGCLPLPVNFSSNSSAGDGAISNYFWDFADGSTQTGAGIGQISHTYTFAQTVAVSLTVTNNHGCYNTLQKQAVVISPAVKAAFTADRTTLCQVNDAVQFTNTSAGGAPLTYNWDFGDGASSTDKDPLHVFNKKGIYTIKLSVTGAGGCTDVSTQAALINVANFTTDFGAPGQICQGASTVLADLSTPKSNSGIWQFDDGTYSYSYNGGSVYHYFNTTGIQTVTLTNTYGTCQQSISKQLNIQKAPVLTDFQYNMEGVCGAPVTVDFKDNSSEAVKWNWSFDPSLPGASSSLQSPSYAYNAEGTYSVQLTITNAAGCSSSTSKPISTYKPAVFVSWISSTSQTGTVSCGDFSMGWQASSNGDPITSYKWDFGDGGTATDAQPVHHFTIPGTYIIHLNYTTKNGCQGVAEYSSVHLYQMPVADFTVSPGTTICGNNPVQFLDKSQGPVSDYHWDFGDNTISSISSPTYRYFKDGVYTVTLTVSNELCSNTLVKTGYITVLPPFPQIGAVINTCDDTRGLVVFTQQTVKGVSWVWDFGDGGNLSLNTDQQTIQHTYTKSGIYNVVLAATNGSCTIRDSVSTAVLLRQNPVLTADQTEVCASDALNVRITGLASNPLYDVYSGYGYKSDTWQYGDKTIFTGSANPGGIYHQNNYYSGSLQGLTTGKDSLRAILLSYGFNCTDTSNYIPLKIKGPVSGYEITTNNVCFKSPVVLKDTAHGTGNVPIRSWLWDFGDGQPETRDQGGIISHSYSNPGYYYPVLTVTDADGCTASSPYYTTDYVQVNGPKAAFSYSPSAVSPNTMVYFDNTTNNTGSYNTQYQWSFGDGSYSSSMYPSHSYSSISTDTVKLIAQNTSMSCADTAIQVLYVKTVHASFSYTTSYINNNSCPPVVIRFSNTSVNANSVSWDFGDGSTADNQSYPSHTYYQPGVYKVVLHGYGNNGANDAIVDSITIKGPYAKLQADTLSGCTGQSVVLSARVRNASSFTWDFADGALGQTQDTFAVHQYLTGGLYTPALIMKDLNGCSATSILDKQIIIDSLHIDIKNRPSHVCDNTLVSLDPAVQSIASGQLQQALQYKWNFGTGIPEDTSITTAAAFTYRHAGRYPLTLRVSSAYGCIKEMTDTILVVDPQPFHLQMAKDAFACPELPLRLQAGGAASYNWINAPGLNNNQVADPLALPPLQEVYTVVGYDPYQCFTDTATVNIHMTPSPTVNAGPDIQVLTGSTLTLQANGSSDVTQWSWTPSDYLSCTDCASPVCTPRSSMSYVVTGKTAYGCPASDTVSLKLICDEGRVYIPNSFSPNGDGKNEIFYIKGRGIRTIRYFNVYNRWGEMIFQRSNFNIGDISAGWDGTFKGNPVETGAYVYLTEMVCDNGEVFPLKGSFIVIR